MLQIRCDSIDFTRDAQNGQFTIYQNIRLLDTKLSG